MIEQNPYHRFWSTHVHNWQTQWSSREYAIRQWSFAVPTEDALEAIGEYSPIIELGAGTGYWAHLLQKRGCEVVPFDRAPAGHPSSCWFSSSKAWTHIHEGGPEVLSYPEYSGHTLFLCWPDYDTSFAFDCLSAYSGDHFIYIGESKGGCTGDDDFHDLLCYKVWPDESEDKHWQWESTKSVSLPQWDGIHDNLEIYQRKA